jgi:hypothetical protein
MSKNLSGVPLIIIIDINVIMKNNYNTNKKVNKAGRGLITSIKAVNR